MLETISSLPACVFGVKGDALFTLLSLKVFLVVDMVFSGVFDVSAWGTMCEL